MYLGVFILPWNTFHLLSNSDSTYRNGTLWVVRSWRILGSLHHCLICFLWSFVLIVHVWTCLEAIWSMRAGKQDWRPRVTEGSRCRQKAAHMYCVHWLKKTVALWRSADISYRKNGFDCIRKDHINCSIWKRVSFFHDCGPCLGTFPL